MFVRLFTGPDGESHFEDLAPPYETQAPRTLQPAEGILFNRIAPGYVNEWHHAPRRQYVIGLSGTVEIEIGSGEKRRFLAGDVLLAEDLDGHGHTTRVVGDEPRVSVMVPLREDGA